MSEAILVTHRSVLGREMFLHSCSALKSRPSPAMILSLDIHTSFIPLLYMECPLLVLFPDHTSTVLRALHLSSALPPLLASFSAVTTDLISSLHSSSCEPDFALTSSIYVWKFFRHIVFFFPVLRSDCATR